MNDRRLTGLLGVIVVAGVVIVGLYGFASSYLLESAGDLLAPSVGTLAVAAIVVAALIILGARSKRWRENPYW
ncbi:hypothetical protein [Natrarchaeobius chitinivorans]|uniref:Major facilitator superfamily (MFS) profile domain-containing protein n=1 Tax=Natrarchaeobius chitinivorans TaxID=1679083 RepID=A0A3N6MNJ0_NATCH|nr:hypothetical protein [Natrarchaeobius chitinivorans]RQG97681.1 hypothetical protein EA473_00195 [Natrarchaeobius chitinivorans]